MKDAFLRWLNAERNANYDVKCRPDNSVPKKKGKEIDYVLEDSARPPALALEISTIWRVSTAAEEDSHFNRWVNEFRTTVCGQVVGTFQLDLPMTLPKGCDSTKFAEELVRVLSRLGAPLAASSKTLPLNIQGVDVRIGRITASGSDIAPARMVASDYRPQLTEDVDKRLKTRAPKLLAYKQTWIRDVARVLQYSLGPFRS